MNPRPLPEKIAIVGVGCVLPDANSPDKFWQNILEKKVSIRRVSDDPPAERVFDVEAHYDPSVLGKADKKNKSYTDVSALVRDFEFDPRKYRIPPTVADHMDENQKIALASADQALSGVNLEKVDREKISVFIGCSMIGETHHAFQKQADFERFEFHLRNHPDFREAMDVDRREALLRDLQATTTPRKMSVTEDSAPGVLPNIVAARIASVFDFHGHAYVVDAACASGLASVICGVQHLVGGESDAVVCGAADMLIGEVGRIYFSGINALSPDGSYPFDERANGFVIGQGGGVVVLKRLSDAVRDGDAIHAVIAGYGQSSDGKGKAIAAPNSVWQAKTIQRAHEMAGFAPDTVELIEAHGTATKVGDASEIKALNTSFRERGVRGTGFCAVGSVKSNIGHLKSAAGMASLVKTIQALRHGILPPSAGCEKVDPKLGIEGSPFFVNTEARPWPAKEHPRRAGVSAFGFGGANYHIALEEYRAGDAVARPAPAPAAVATEIVATPSATSRIVLLSGTDDAQLASRAKAMLENLRREPSRLAELALEESYRADAAHPHRLAVVFDGAETLAAKIAQWSNTPDPAARRLLRAKGIFWGEGAGTDLSRTAFLFPGQGSQYSDMLSGLAGRFPSVRRTVSRIDAFWAEKNGESVSSLVSSRVRGKEATEALLKNTRNTHPALLWGNLAVASLLQDMGVRPAWMIGHSAGEVVALAAAGKLSLPDALRTMDERSRAFVEMETDDFGKMVAVRTDRASLEGLIARSGLPVEIANLNAPDQIIASGPSEAIGSFCAFLKTENVKHVELNVSHAFHSAVVAPAARQFGAAIGDLTFSRGHAEVLVNETRTPYPDSDAECRALLRSQVTAPVDFCGGIEELHRRGVRLFVEVGPGSVLGNLVQSILKDRDAVVVSCNHKNADELESLHKALGTLFAEGIGLDLIPASETFSVNTAASAVPASAAVAAPAPAATEQRHAARLPEPARKRVVYSGVSVGLPGSFRPSFQDDNFERLFAGHNFIERLADAEKERLADLRVTRVEKTEQGPVFQVLDTIQDVIQLAGKIGKIDALADYAIDPKESAQMNQAILHGVAAGYEALRDARIPLVRQYARTASGSLLPDRWVLPQALQKRTGVIFAHSFPMVETVIQEVSRHLQDKLGSRLGSELLEFYQSLVQQVRDQQARKLLTDWFVLHRNRLSPSAGSDEVYSFNHQFINQISMLANNRLASLVCAMGPNFQINAACSSTCTAVTLAEEMIRSGRADRFLVIAADDATSQASFPYLGAGFLSTGAASTEADLYKAALPFDLRRNGMVMSAGAVGIVVESAEAVAERGIAPVCELLGTHVFNTAGHHARLDIPRYAEELDEFLVRMEAEHGFARRDIAPSLLYLSHETYTPARGGCSEAEAVSLRHAFGPAFSEIEVANTKGMTGHTMGTSIEDVVAARALQTGLVPPVVNHQVPDPALAGLKLSKGGRHGRRFALRLAAGFGSQGNYVLLRKVDGPADRVTDSVKQAKWLESVSGQSAPQLEVSGRVLRVRDTKPGAVVADRPNVDCAAPNSAAAPKSASTPATSTPKPTLTTASRASDEASVLRQILEVVSGITGYPASSIEPDMEIEADLGVDTVKQATILALLGERFGTDPGAGFQISAYPTIGHLVRLFAGAATPASGASSNSVTAATPAAKAPTLQAAPAPAAADAKAVQDQVLAVVSEITGYPPEMIEPDMEIEADLGVDTVKQATILAVLGERFGTDPGAGFQISAYPTIGHLVRLFAGTATTASAAPSNSVTAAAPAAKAPSILGAPAAADAKAVQDQVVAVVSEITGYPPEMIEPDMEIEADLGVDTVKQATILAMLGERFGTDPGAGFQISAYPTIGHLVRLFAGAATPASAAPSNSVTAAAPAAKAPSILGAPAAADAKAVQDQVVAVVSEITGYPPEMIEPDMEIEADLGVDTVKQATILAMLGERFGTDPGAGFQISAYPTIGHLVRLFAGAATPASAAPSNSVIAPSATAATPTSEAGLSRQTLRLEAQPFEGTRSSLASKSVLVIADDASVALDFARRLSEAVRRVAILAIPRDGDPDLAARTLQERNEDPADIWIDLGARGSDTDLLDLEAAAAHDAVSRMAECRYALCKHVEAAGAGRPSRLLFVARSADDPVDGFLTGFYLSLGKEWSIPSQALEVEGPETLAPAALAELAHDASVARAAYRDGIRHALKVVDEPVASDSPLPFDASDTILITGGANGIAAQVVLGLAAKHPAQFVVVGRTPLEAIDFADPRWDDARLSERREEWREKLAQSGARLTPALLDREFSRVLKQREIARTLDAVRALGRSIHYLAADVTDLSGLRAGLEPILSMTGNVTALVHAAGMDLSRPLARKTLEEFSMVHRIKTEGALNLLRVVAPEHLKLVCAFTSISGVFGNAAQMDYSPANAFLDAFARSLPKRYPGLRAMSLAWSGWRDVGMAWRNDFVREHAEAMGLGLIPPSTGVAAALDELARNRGGLAILHRGLGGMLDARWTSRNAPDLPMIDHVESLPDGARRAHRVFSPERDEFLHQHRLHGVPLMPGVGFLEFMAEFHRRLEPAEGAYRFRNLSFHDAFKFHRDQARDTWIEARPTAEAGEWAMRIHSPFRSRIGDRVEVRDYCAAAVSRGRFAAPATARGGALEAPEHREYGQILSHLDRIPQNVVFGPLFHDSRHPEPLLPDIVVAWNRAGLRTPYRLPRAQTGNPRYPLERFQLNPCLLDSLHQAGVIHTILRTGQVHLPFGAEEFVVAGKQDRPGTYHVQVDLVEERPDVFVYDILLTDESGTPCAWIHRSSYHRIAS